MGSRDHFDFYGRRDRWWSFFKVVGAPRGCRSHVYRCGGALTITVRDEACSATAKQDEDFRLCAPRDSCSPNQWGDVTGNRWSHLARGLAATALTGRDQWDRHVECRGAWFGGERGRCSTVAVTRTQ